MGLQRNQILQQLTRAAFLVRLLALLLGLASLTGRTLVVPHLLAVVVLGGTCVMGLTRSDAVMGLVSRHPSVAMLDLLLVVSVGEYSRTSSLFNLAMLSTAVLLGLWVDLWAAAIVLVTLLSLFVLQVLHQHVAIGQLLTLPFAYLALWFLALSVRRAIRQESSTAHLVRASVTAAAAAEERAKVAGELHDQVAKSIQGTALAASTLPALIRRDPARAAAVAEQTHQMATRAVADLRSVMSDLQVHGQYQPFGEALVGLVQAWEVRAGRRAVMGVDPALEMPCPALQFEALACVEELLDNVAAHAGPCETRISAVVTQGYLFVSVTDDGRGADPARLEAARRAGHMGLQGLSGRMARVGGSVEVDTAPGQGMRVELLAPVEQLVERVAS